MEVKIIPVKLNQSTPSVAKPYDENGNTLQPAITFSPGHIVYGDGGKVENGGIYENFLNINEECLNNVIKSIAKSGANPEFVGGIIKTISQTNTNAIEDSFFNSIYSHYCAFVAKVNHIIDAIYNNQAPMTVTKMDLNDLSYLRNRYLAYGINNFMNLSMNERTNLLESNVMTNFCIAFVNAIGEYEYTKAMVAISEALAGSTVESDLNPEERVIIPYINKEFCVMMADMTYEICAFISNLENYHHLVFSNEEVASFKYLNNPEKNPYKNPNFDPNDRDEGVF